jgi:hypothetical protein
MDEKISQYFGLIIAFLIPGMVGLYALSFFEPALREWFGLAASSPTTIGGFLFVILASVGMGVFLSGVRWFVCENCFSLFPSAPPLQVEDRQDERKDKAYQDIRAQHYVYYLFYANLMIALLLLFVCWFLRAEPRPQWRDIGVGLGVLIAVMVVLYFSARDALAKFDLKAGRLLGFAKPPTRAAR